MHLSFSQRIQDLMMMTAREPRRHIAFRDTKQKEGAYRRRRRRRRRLRRLLRLLGFCYLNLVIQELQSSSPFRPFADERCIGLQDSCFSYK
jgi:hypothetical protein